MIPHTSVSSHLFVSSLLVSSRLTSPDLHRPSPARPISWRHQDLHLGSPSQSFKIDNGLPSPPRLGKGGCVGAYSTHAGGTGTVLPVPMPMSFLGLAKCYLGLPRACTDCPDDDTNTARSQLMEWAAKVTAGEMPLVGEKQAAFSHSAEGDFLNASLSYYACHFCDWVHGVLVPSRRFSVFLHPDWTGHIENRLWMMPHTQTHKAGLPAPMKRSASHPSTKVRLPILIRRA